MPEFYCPPAVVMAMRHEAAAIRAKRRRRRQWRERQAMERAWSFRRMERAA